MAWDEFQRNHTVDSRTERSFMTGVMEYTPGVNQERIHHVEFVHLLCLLADGEKVDLCYTRGDEAHRTPLEIALDNVTKLEESLKQKSPMRSEMAEMRRLIKIQAVLALLRARDTQSAKDLLLALWPKQIKRSAEDKEVVTTLNAMIEGKKNKAFDAAHSHPKFCQSLIPILKQVHDQFKRPFLIEVIAKKKDIQTAKPATVIPHSQLKKVEEGKASSSSSSPRSTPRRGLKLPASSTSEEEPSPAKRGRSIRSLRYGQSSKIAKKSSDPEKNPEKVEWDSIIDSDEEGELKTRINGDKSINTPVINATLGEIPGNIPHRKHHKNPTPTKRRPWSSEEEEELKLGINRFGVGKWAEINEAYSFNNRTNVQLKDKYRTMVKQGLI
ncbi:telomeric repeat-binding factor 2-like isoform X2 [Lytechinus variegatus]|nr:telomeric repeat-binding factor 2-like isoform X2 [Lytechinus variegatus]